MNPHLFFEVKDIDSVRFFGSVSYSAEKEEVLEILKGIKDIKKIKNDLAILTMR